MAIETKWKLVPPVAFTADGTSGGIITLLDTSGFKVKQSVAVQSNSIAGPKCLLRVIRVISPTQLKVGVLFPKQGHWTEGYDVSAYTVANGATLSADEQDKNNIKLDDIQKAVYEQEPTVALRNVLVDQYGDFYTDTNPLPVTFDGTVSIGEVEVVGPSGNALDPNTDGSINVNVISGATAGNTVNQYATYASSTTNVEFTILTYTVPTLFKGSISKVSASGENQAKFTVKLNGSPIEVQRTYYSNYNVLFDFTPGGVPLVAGDVVTVTGIQYTPGNAQYDSRIQLSLTPT